MEDPQRSDRFELTNRIFSEALKLPPDQRTTFVRRRCGDDPSLRDTVIGLISQFNELGDFLEEPAIAGLRSIPCLDEGMLLCGRFRIQKRLGAGGMGEVFRAQDEVLGEVVALKSIHATLRNSRAVLARFHEEIRLARKISHPNICKIFDLFTDTRFESGPIDFFTMQYLPGGNLADRIAASAPFAEGEILSMSNQIASGLDAAHKAGIVHRDLKPANIILIPDRDSTVRPVITDFGLARPLQRDVIESVHTLAGQIMGSPDYMAPEQFESAPTQPATDVFAFGVIIFEMVTGHRPYPAEGIVAAAVRRATMPPPALRDLAPRVPPHWDRVIRKALSRNPEDRYSSAGEMVRELANPGLIQALSAREVSHKTTRRSVLSMGALATCVAAYFGIPRFRNWGEALHPIPLIMLNRLTHAAADAVESDALDITLANQLSQSAHLRLLGRERIAQSWRLIRNSGTQPLPSTFEPRTARDIALRSGAQIVIFGGYVRLGDQRTLSLQVELMGNDPEQPRRSWLRHFDTNRASDLAVTGHQAGAWLRRAIGETETQLEKQNRPPDDLTTPYWPALQEFVQGHEASQAGESGAAVIHFRTALRIDPDFALAAARLADILRSEGQLDEALVYWSRASQILSRRNLTDRESLRIQGQFADDTCQYAGAEQIFARYALEFPEDSHPLFYRASVLDNLGHYEEAERLYTLAIQREPLYSFYITRAAFFLAQGRLDDATKDLGIGKLLNPNDWTDRLRIAIAFARGDFREVQAGLDRLKSEGTVAGKSQAFVVDASLRAEHGDVSGADEVFRAGIAYDRTMGLPGSSQLEKQYLLAQLLHSSVPAETIRIAETALRAGAGPTMRMRFGAVLAQAGRIQAAKSCRVSGLPEWRIYQILASRLEGEIAFAQHDFAGAVRHFRIAVQPPHTRAWPDFLVRAALAAGDQATAGETLRALFAAPGIYWLGVEFNAPGFMRNAIHTVKQTAKWPDLLKQVDLFAPLSNKLLH